MGQVGVIVRQQMKVGKMGGLLLCINVLYFVSHSFLPYLFHLYFFIPVTYS